MSTVKLEDYLVPQGIVSLMDKDIDPDDTINITATGFRAHFIQDALEQLGIDIEGENGQVRC